MDWGVKAQRSNDVYTYMTYFEEKNKKIEMQLDPPVSDIFKGCVFYILGFVGRGEESRINLTNEIHKNGGRTVMMITSKTTHVIAKNACHARLRNLKSQIEKNKIKILSPEYIQDCLALGKKLPEKPYLLYKCKGPHIDDFFTKEKTDT